jgi:hypothetical protein
MSKLARVTEELESLINPTASTVNEEEEEEQQKENEKEVLTSIEQEEPTMIKFMEPEESIVLPQLPTLIEKPEKVSPSIEQQKPTVTTIVEPEESIVLPQIPASVTITAEEEKKMDIITTEVSDCL